MEAEAIGVDFTTQAMPKSRFAGSQGQGGQGNSASSLDGFGAKVANKAYGTEDSNSGKEAQEAKSKEADKAKAKWPLLKSSAKCMAKANGTKDSKLGKEVKEAKNQNEAGGYFTTQALPKSRFAGSQGKSEHKAFEEWQWARNGWW